MIEMRCGAKRFSILYENETEQTSKTVIARTPAEARKKIKEICGQHIQVLSVRSHKE